MWNIVQYTAADHVNDNAKSRTQDKQDLTRNAVKTAQINTAQRPSW